MFRCFGSLSLPPPPIPLSVRLGLPLPETAFLSFFATVNTLTMAVVASRIRAHAQLNERRSPQAAASSSAAAETAQSTAAAAAPKLTTHTLTALTIIIVILGVIMLGFATWRLVAWRRRRRSAPSDVVDGMSTEKWNPFGVESWAQVEKPGAAVLVPPTPAPGTTWVPQIRSTASGPVSVPSPVKKKSSLRTKSKWDKPLTIANPEYSPPPAYNGSNRSEAQHYLPPPPPIPSNKTKTAPPPTPPASLKLKTASPFETEAPAPSPRSSSFPSSQRKSTTSSRADKKLPRLMSVCMTFDPALEDELAIQFGEAVRMLEEYEDEWCLVQRVGKSDAPKGVVPRFCLQERPDVIPAHPPLSWR
ncbi:hypothetical protein PLICRDRAFT_54014 [Plicaturopsis crispa FD-325 SS-3]|nr:hypothetical protein PLICRDRAFT_54014 [Plicaturopsis crispa FD-325 SS-3]